MPQLVVHCHYSRGVVLRQRFIGGSVWYFVHSPTRSRRFLATWLTYSLQLTMEVIISCFLQRKKKVKEMPYSCSALQYRSVVCPVKLAAAIIRLFHQSAMIGPDEILNCLNIDGGSLLWPISIWCVDHVVNRAPTATRCFCRARHKESYSCRSSSSQFSSCFAKRPEMTLALSISSVLSGPGPRLLAGQ